MELLKRDSIITNYRPKWLPPHPSRAILVQLWSIPTPSSIILVRFVGFDGVYADVILGEELVHVPSPSEGEFMHISFGASGAGRNRSNLRFETDLDLHEHFTLPFRLERSSFRSKVQSSALFVLLYGNIINTSVEYGGSEA